MVSGLRKEVAERDFFTSKDFLINLQYIIIMLGLIDSNYYNNSGYYHASS